MTTYMTHFDPATRQPTAPSQPLPCATLAEAVAMMGAPAKPYRAVPVYEGFCLSRFAICIDEPANSGHTVTDSEPTGSNQP